MTRKGKRKGNKGGWGGGGGGGGRRKAPKVQQVSAKSLAKGNTCTQTIVYFFRSDFAQRELTDGYWHGSRQSVRSKCLEGYNQRRNRDDILQDVTEIIRGAPGVRFPVAALQQMVVQCVRYGILDVCAEILENCADTERPFTVKQSVQIILALPQCHGLELVNPTKPAVGTTPHALMGPLTANPVAAANLVDHVTEFTVFNAESRPLSRGAEMFFRSRCRWSVLEFMTEAHTLHTSPAKPFDVINGVKGGGAGMKSGEISFGNAGVGNAGDRRGIVSGDYVRVVPVDASEFMFEAQVVKISAPLVVKPIDRVDYDHFIKHSNPTTTFRIEKLANRVGFLRQLEAVGEIVTCALEGSVGKSDPAIEIVRALTLSLVERGPTIAAFCCQPLRTPYGGMQMGASHSHPVARGLNPSQYDALRRATSQRLTLVQGPPGCGKTAVSIKIVKFWVETRAFGTGSGILCCSDSNTAVDNLVAGLAAERIDVVRLGRPENTRNDLLRYSFDEQVKDKAGLDVNDPQVRFMVGNQILRRAQVICTTCVGAGSARLSERTFGGVLVDESAQATEAACIVPLTLGCQQLVLVGDHFQLPPTVISEQADAEQLTLSLFERLVQAGVAPALLDTQYRMHPAISQFPSDCFYGGRIRDGITAAHRPTPLGISWPRPDFPVMFLPVDHARERSEGTSKINDAEVRVIGSLVERLLLAGLPMNEIGIVTPYGSQVREIRRELGPSRRDVECHSVDGFQGREKTVILFSAVRANSGGHVGFLADWCRTNVAVTRAKNGLVVVGNEATLRSDKRSWEPFLDWAYAQGVVSGRPRSSTPYEGDMQTRTQSLATGEKTFLDHVKFEQRSRLGIEVDSGPAPHRTNGASAANQSTLSSHKAPLFTSHQLTASAHQPATHQTTLFAAPSIGSSTSVQPTSVNASQLRPTATTFQAAQPPPLYRSKYASGGDPSMHIPPLALGELVTVVAKLDTGWTQIRTANGLIGYVSAAWIEPVEVNALSPTVASGSVKKVERTKTKTTHISVQQPTVNEAFEEQSNSHLVENGGHQSISVTTAGKAYQVKGGLLSVNEVKETPLNEGAVAALKEDEIRGRTMDRSQTQQSARTGVHSRLRSPYSPEPRRSKRRRSRSRSQDRSRRRCDDARSGWSRSPSPERQRRRSFSRSSSPAHRSHRRSRSRSRSRRGYIESERSWRASTRSVSPHSRRKSRSRSRSRRENRHSRRSRHTRSPSPRRRSRSPSPRRSRSPSSRRSRSPQRRHWSPCGLRAWSRSPSPPSRRNSRSRSTTPNRSTR